MTKNLNHIRQAVLSKKNALPKVQSLPTKPRQHRYERRKIKGFLQVDTWVEADLTAT